MPTTSAFFGPCFAATRPAGSWKTATRTRTKVVVTRPSPETFWRRSEAMRGEGTEEGLYQFMAQTNWTTIMVRSAFRFSTLSELGRSGY